MTKVKIIIILKLLIPNDLPLFITLVILLLIVPNCRKRRNKKLAMMAIEKLKYFTTVSKRIKFKYVHHFIIDV